MMIRDGITPHSFTVRARMLQRSLPLIVCLAGVLLGWRVSAANSLPLPALSPMHGNVTILYDSRGANGDYGTLYSQILRNLLGHFGCTVSIKPVERYRTIDLRNITALFYIGSSYDNPLPVPLLRDLVKTQVPVCWIGYNLWQYQQQPALEKDFARRYNFRYLRYVSDPAQFPTIRYKATYLQRKSTQQGVGVVQIDDPAQVTVHATCLNQDEEIPYILQAQNFWYVADIPLNDLTLTDRYLAFADLLHDILGCDHPEQHLAYLRIEDVSPIADPAKLRAIADFLFEQGIPFGISVIPVYLDPLHVYNGGEIVRRTLADSPDFVQALHYMLEKGGQILLHGYTHQYGIIQNPHSGVSGEDFEFFRVAKDAATGATCMVGPLPEDSEEWVCERLDQALALFQAAKLPVTAWNTPHYLASHLDYQIFARYFPYSVDRGLCYSDSGALYAQQMAPYLLKDSYGAIRIPETIGYVTPTPADDDQRIPLRERAMANLVVRDGWAGCFYHWDVDHQSLQELVSELRKCGYHFTRIPDAPPEREKR